MDDFLAGVLAAIAEVLFEAIFEIALEGLASLLIRAIAKFLKTVSDVKPVAATLALAMLGALVGFFSAVAFPHSFVHPSRFHGVSVIASPLITGMVMSQLGRFLRNHGKRVMPIESFSYGFVFAIAMALVRFLMIG